MEIFKTIFEAIAQNLISVHHFLMALAVVMFIVFVISLGEK